MTKEHSFSITNLLNLKEEQKIGHDNDSGFAEESVTMNCTPTPPSPDVVTHRDFSSCGLMPSAKNYSRRRAKRTKWPSQLLEKMQEVFRTVDRKPSHRQIMEQLAEGDELLASKIQIWFQNKRASVKKQNKTPQTDEHSFRHSKATDPSPTSLHSTIAASPGSSGQLTMTTLFSATPSKSSISVTQESYPTTTSSRGERKKRSDVKQTNASDYPVMTSTPVGRQFARRRKHTRESVVVTEASSSSHTPPITTSVPSARAKNRKLSAVSDGKSSSAQTEPGTASLSYHARSEPLASLGSASLGFGTSAFFNYQSNINPAFHNSHFGINQNFRDYHLPGLVEISPIIPCMKPYGFYHFTFGSTQTSPNVLTPGQRFAGRNPVAFTTNVSVQESSLGFKATSHEANQNSTSSGSVRVIPTDFHTTVPTSDPCLTHTTDEARSKFYLSESYNSQAFHRGRLLSSLAAVRLPASTSQPFFREGWTDTGGETIFQNYSPAAGHSGSAFRPFQRN